MRVRTNKSRYVVRDFTNPVASKSNDNKVTDMLQSSMVNDIQKPSSSLNNHFILSNIQLSKFDNRQNENPR